MKMTDGEIVCRSMVMLDHLWKQADLGDPIWTAARERAGTAPDGPFSLISDRPGRRYPADRVDVFSSRPVEWPRF